MIARRRAPYVSLALVAGLVGLFLLLGLLNLGPALALTVSGDAQPAPQSNPAAAPRFRVNVSHDWVGADYEVGRTFFITVVNLVGTVKGTAMVDTAPGGGWDSDGFQSEDWHWSPRKPDIAPYDTVSFRADDGYTNTVRVGDISGLLDVQMNRIDGPIAAPWLASQTSQLAVSCLPWGAWKAGLAAPVKTSTAAPDGTVPYACQWQRATEWSIEPNQDLAVVYDEPDGDQVIRVFSQPAPHLHIDQWGEGEPGEGGNFRLTIRLRNKGQATAANVVITDTLDGLRYLVDTSVYPVITDTAPGQNQLAAFRIGSLAPGREVQFDLYVAIEESQGRAVQNSLLVVTSSLDDQGQASEKTHTWVGDVVANDTQLNVAKEALTDDPAPGQDVVFKVEVCNHGRTGSAAIQLTDLTPANLVVQEWWSENTGWFPPEDTPADFALTNFSLPSLSCSQVFISSHVAASVQAGEPLSNTAVITAANDLDPADNQAVWTGLAGQPHLNLWVEKAWQQGVLVPGGQIVYDLIYGNSGNIPAGPFTITDTLPAGTRFIEARRYDAFGSRRLTPASLDDGQATWNLTGIDNGYPNRLEVRLAVRPATPTGTLLLNAVALTPLPGEDSHLDNQAYFTETLNPPGPNLRVSKWQAWAGDSALDYRVRFENVGDQAVQNVGITDTLPAGTSWAGQQRVEFDRERPLVFEHLPGQNQLTWLVSELRPGEAGWLEFSATLDEPGALVRTYTNTVSISLPAGDPTPQDNVDQVAAFSGGEVGQVELWLEPYGPGWLSGQALPGLAVTVTTPHTQVSALADPDCGGCWTVDDAGPLLPGETISVVAGSGQLPVVVTLPDPLVARLDTAANRAFGQIGGWSGQPVEVIADWIGGPRQVATDAAGNFEVDFPEVSRGASALLRWQDEIAAAVVVVQRPLTSLDLVLEADYANDSVRGFYEPGHTVWITVTAADGQTVKSVARITSDFLEGQAEPGFSTDPTGWLGNRPNLQPEDWVYGRVDNGQISELRIGQISGQPDAGADIVSGTLTAPWFNESLAARCRPDTLGGPELLFEVHPSGGGYLCDLSTLGFDLLRGQDVVVTYWEPDLDQVSNVFTEPVPDLALAMDAYASSPGAGGNMRFRVAYENRGGAPAEDVVITTTLAGLSFLTDTSPVTVSTQTITGGQVAVFSLGALAAGQQGAFDLFTAVEAGPGQIVTNTTEIATPNPYERGRPSERIGRWSDMVLDAGSNLTVTKTSQTGDPAAGATFVFNIDICNLSAVASAQVVLTDTLHPSMTLQSWLGREPGWLELDRQANQLVLANPSLPGAACGRVDATVRLDPAAPRTLVISNTVVISSSNDLDASDNVASWQAEVSGPHVNLGVDKWLLGATLVPGGQIRYGMRYENTGNVAVESPVHITDTLPTDTSFEAAWIKDEGGWRPFTPTLAGPNILVWELPGLANDFSREVELILALDETTTPGTILTNSVEISPQPEEDSYDDNQATWVEAVYPTGSNLRVRKVGRWLCCQDSRRAHYDLYLDNIGTTFVTDVPFADHYPAEMALESFETDWSRLADWGHDPDAKTITAVVAYLAAGDSIRFSLETIVPGEGPLPFGQRYTNTGQVTTSAADVHKEDNTAAVVLDTGPDLYVHKRLAGGRVLPGEQITFSLAFGNGAPAEAPWRDLAGQAILTDSTPPGFGYVGAVRRYCDGGDWCPVEPVQQGQALVWDLGSLAAGQSDEILLTLKVPKTAEGDDTFTNTARIASTLPAVDVEPQTTNNQDAVNLPVDLPVLRVSKIFQSIEVGGTSVTYIIRVNNSGYGDAGQLVLSDTLPIGLNHNGGGSFDGKDIVWTIPAVPALGGVATAAYSATLPCSGTIVNEHYQVVSSAQGVSSPPGEPLSLDVVAARIQVDLAHSPGPFVAGDRLTFTATARTNGLPLETYLWDFGDGNTAAGLTTEHAYLAGGTFTVTFSVADGCGYQATALAEIPIQPPALAASFAVGPGPLRQDITVTFTDTSTTNGRPIVSRSWDFGDGSDPVDGLQASHVYTAGGVYTVTLTVVDELGFSDVSARPVEVISRYDLYLPLARRP